MKKKILALTLVAVIAIPTASAFAGSKKGEAGGSLTIVRDGITALETEYVGGGTWKHGFYTDYAAHYSKYLHTTKEHKASAGNWNGSVSSEWIAGGVSNWAEAECVDTLWGNTVNWNTR